MDKSIEITIKGQRPRSLYRAYLFPILSLLMGIRAIAPTPVVGQPPPSTSAPIHSPAANRPLLETVRTLNQLVEQPQKQGQYTEIIPYAKRSLAILERLLGPEHPTIARGLNNLAELYQVEGNYAAAERLFQRALAIREKSVGPQHPDVAYSLNNLAKLYAIQGNYVAAETFHQRALGIFEQALGPTHLDVAGSLNNLAGTYSAQGHYAAAKPLYERALTIFEQVLGPEHPHTATSLNNLGHLYSSQQNYTAAKPFYERALAIQEQVLGPEHPHTATSLSNLGHLYNSQGNYAAAEPLLQRALAITEQSLGPKHFSVAKSLNNLATLSKAQGNTAAAESFLQRALAIYEQALGPDHPEVANSLNNLAVLYWAQGQTARATERTTRAANIEEHNLALILATGSEARKRSYLATLSGTTDARVSFHLQDAPNDLTAARLALTTVLRRKGRILNVLTDSLQALRQHSTPTDQMLLDQLEAVRAQIATLVFRGVGNTPIAQYRAILTDLRAKAEQLENQLARRSSEFRVQPQTVTIAAIQQQIPPNAALIEWVRYQPFNPKVAQPNQRWGAPRYAAYILKSQGEPQWVDLGEAAAIDQAVTDFRNTISDPSSLSTKPATARTLDQLLLLPVRQRLGNVQHLLLSPDSQLNLVPFAALVDENDRYLIETHTLTLLTTGRDLLRFSTPTANRQPPVILANPNFDTAGKPIAVANRRNRDANSRRSRDLTPFNFDPLPGTAAEADAIAALLPNERLLTESNATENALKQLQGPQILHLATHGFFLELKSEPPGHRFDSPLQPNSNASSLSTVVRREHPLLLRSGLALAGIKNFDSGDQDGVLTALEAAGLDLRGTQLVALSACETGVGAISNGEGVYGLRRAFVIAGAESQLFSLWSVDDLSTRDLMVGYYQRLLKGEGRSEALRQTQLAMLNSQQYSHPYHWAAFIPSGNWTPME